MMGRTGNLISENIGDGILREIINCPLREQEEMK
jgi:hypothetical protein